MAGMYTCYDQAMKRMLAIVVVSAMATRAHAGDDDDQMYKCRTPDPQTKISVSFKPNVSLHDLAAWALGFTCKNIVFSADVEAAAINVTVIAPKPLTPKQAMELFVDSIEATGLVVTQKPDTIIIKLGPNMPRNCPKVAAASTAPPVRQLPPVVSEPPELTDKDIAAGIRTIDDTHHEMTAALRDQILGNPMSAAKGARVVPAMANGKADGFKLYAVRPSSVWALLGFTNGDTLNSINGIPVTSADQALDIYTKARDAKKLEAVITRRGKPLTLVVTIK